MEVELGRSRKLSHGTVGMLGRKASKAKSYDIHTLQERRTGAPLCSDMICMEESSAVNLNSELIAKRNM